MYSLTSSSRLGGDACCSARSSGERQRLQRLQHSHRQLRRSRDGMLLCARRSYAVHQARDSRLRSAELRCPCSSASAGVCQSDPLQTSTLHAPACPARASRHRSALSLQQWRWRVALRAIRTARAAAVRHLPAQQAQHPNLVVQRARSQPSSAACRALHWMRRSAPPHAPPPAPRPAVRQGQRRRRREREAALPRQHGPHLQQTPLPGRTQARCIGSETGLRVMHMLDQRTSSSARSDASRALRACAASCAAACSSERAAAHSARSEAAAATRTAPASAALLRKAASEAAT
jgi:hypothetical protein